MLTQKSYVCYVRSTHGAVCTIVVTAEDAYDARKQLLELCPEHTILRIEYTK